MHYFIQLSPFLYIYAKLTAPPPTPPRRRESPTPNPSPLERGVNTLASCWRTGRGGHRPTWIIHD